MMSDSRQPRGDKNSVGNEGTEAIIKDNAADPQAALPPGTLKGPFLERQGDEQRQPSKNERRKLAEIRTRQRGEGKD
jgi:hypothetical protein